MDTESYRRPIDCMILGDCCEILNHVEPGYFSACITDPPYNYEFVGRNWDAGEIERRVTRIKKSKTLVKNIPYGSGLAGGVRNARWYQRVRENILEYQEWCLKWGRQVFRTLKPGGFVLAFNSTRTVAHVQVALENAGFYARDILVYRRHAGIPKGLNAAKKLKALADPSFDAWDGWHSCLRNEWEAICLLQKPLVENYITTLREHKLGLLHTQMAEEGFLSNIIENIKRGPGDDIQGHCTVKPLELMKHLVRLTVPEVGEHVVLDPFAGTGTTCVAAKEAGHHYVGIDRNSGYLVIAKSRLSKEFSDTKQHRQQPLFTY